MPGKKNLRWLESSATFVCFQRLIYVCSCTHVHKDTSLFSANEASRSMILEYTFQNGLLFKFFSCQMLKKVQRKIQYMQ